MIKREEIPNMYQKPGQFGWNLQSKAQTSKCIKRIKLQPWLVRKKMVPWTWYTDWLIFICLNLKGFFVFEQKNCHFWQFCGFLAPSAANQHCQKWTNIIAWFTDQVIQCYNVIFIGVFFFSHPLSPDLFFSDLSVSSGQVSSFEHRDNGTTCYSTRWSS